MTAIPLSQKDLDPFNGRSLRVSKSNAWPAARSLVARNATSWYKHQQSKIDVSVSTILENLRFSKNLAIDVYVCLQLKRGVPERQSERVTLNCP